MDKFIQEKIRVTLDNLSNISEKTVLKVSELRYIESGYKRSQEYPVFDENWKVLKRHERICGKDDHFWFYTKIKTPQINSDRSLYLKITTDIKSGWDLYNPQGLIYLNGEIVQGIDKNHCTVVLEPNKEYEVMMYFYVGMEQTFTEVMMDIIECNNTIKELYYDMKVPYDAMLCFDREDYNHITILKHLERACNIIDFSDINSESFCKSIQSSTEYLKEEFYKKECGSSNVTVNYVGHSHIDVAWLWTLDQTKEKVQRTFSTVLTLMEKYPEFVFMSSQPQLYEYLKQEEPQLYEKVKERVKQGRWEVEGAMWLEADCNLSSGESLIRQISHGKKFIRDEFGIESKILWLPDVFGYSAALPQILKKTGVEKFVTSKISWNESNQLPYDTFMWQGIDGTEIFSYFLTAQKNTFDTSITYACDFFTTYNGDITPSMNLGTWKRYQQKEYSNETLVSFGYGDGGGGPSDEMLQTQRRLAYGLPGVPKTKMSFAGDFLNKLEESFEKNCQMMGRTPKWVGELYLEYHRGTYTSMAKNKKNNRESEFLLMETETLSVIDELFTKACYPHNELEKGWKTVLLNQFHDIIPGSSIKEVYDESDRQYLALKQNIGAIKSDKLRQIADNVAEQGIVVYNPNSFTTSGYVKYNDDVIYAENVPAFGWRVINEQKIENEIKINDKVIENGYYIIVFDDDMNIISLYDKTYKREVIAENGKGNELCVFEDYPKYFDNWEITNYYKQKRKTVNNVISVEKISGNGYGGFKIVRQYMNSTITQNVVVYDKSRRIDFENKIDWHEEHVLLKTVFPVSVHSNKANYEIQFGYVERPNHENTSWDAAKFEVCAHKWGDISEEGYGVSVLNNCKYGYSALGNEITLTLIKCGTYPNEEADKGMHEFTYSLYPHGDDFKHGGTINEAYLLNRPMSALKAVGGGTLPSTFSLVSCENENIVIETIKQSEQKDGIIIRMYDAWNKKSDVMLNLGFSAKSIWMCDMLENKIKEIGSGESINVNVSNFEIVTLYAQL